MLSFSRKSDSRFITHDMAELLEKAIDLAASDYNLKKKYDFRKIEIVREYDPDLPETPCEESKLQQVFFNILKNGAQAMTKNSENISPKFILRTCLDRDMARIEIEDNGPGMDKATCKRVFDPFFTTKKVGFGTGLGLSVSYFIITENHGGNLFVSSTQGKGAKFSIILPITAV
ncbi:ATP-binding protein [Desulfobacterales bacterium HSG16]|nr:ATP-binding protein [Desulfobacterales bacterium HSG16]